MDPKFLALASQIAETFLWHASPMVDKDSVRSAAYFGLWKALRSHDPTRGPFVPYAQQRIRGEILDEIRDHSLVKRDGLKWRKRLHEKKQALEQAEGREISEQEFAEREGLTPLQVRYMQTVIPEHDVDWEHLKIEHRTPADHVLQNELNEKLVACLRTLKESHQLALLQRYVFDEPLQELAQELGVSPSRVSQLLGDAVKAFQRQFKRSYPEEFAES